MSANPAESERALADWFDTLIVLDADARSARLNALPAALSTRLRALLDADAAADAAIESALRPDAEAAVAPDMSGQRIGAWRVLRELGAGGMGTVLLAEREEAGFTQQAAIKLIRGFPSRDGIRRLRQERQILAQLDHPDIARLIDGGETDAGQPFLVVEYVRGETLDVYLRTKQPDRDARIALIERIGAAVQHAHQHLVIHRDLKPSNVMVNDAGDIKLLDFGVAKLIDVGDSHLQGSTRVFTPGYASPEQTAGRSVGIATDIYSLGAMLREACDGDRIDAELGGIIAKATAVLPGDRYVTVAAFCDDLARYRRGWPISAAADTRWYRARKFVARHRLGTAASLIALALGLAFVWRLQIERTRAVAAEATAARERDSARQSLALLQGIFDRIAPGVALGKPIGTRDFIAATEAQLAKQPIADVHAGTSVHATLAAIYQQLGDPVRAAELLRGLLARLPDPGNEGEALERAALHEELASALMGTSDLDGAGQAFATAAALRARWAPEQPEGRFRTLRNRGWLTYRRGLNEQARPDLEAALTLAKQHPDLLDQRVEDTIAALSDIALRRGELESADTYSREHLGRVEARVQRGHPDLIAALRQRATVLNQLGRYRDAQQMLRDAIAMHEQVIGDRGTRLADLENDLAVSLNDSGEALAALPHAERALALTDQNRNSPLDRAVVLVNLASTFENAGDYPRAEALMQEGVSLYATHSPPEAKDRLRAEGNLARVLGLRDRFAESRALFEAVRSRHQEIDGERGWSWAFESVRQAQMERRAGRYDAAIALLDAAEPVFAAALPERHPGLAQPLRIRAQIALAQGRLDVAKPLFDRAAALIGDDALAFDRAIVAAEQAAVAAASGDRDGARALLVQHLPTLRAATLPDEANRRFADALARQLDLP
ncbi:MAG TPA: serine/threonine-protein kinase [Patescibacteria group bacterium]|nr:serine/threonine-protein kinase [Patescibacteria group bacterium]